LHSPVISPYILSFPTRRSSDLISHFLEEVREIAGRYTILRDGRSVDSGSIAGTSNDQLIAHMVGRAALTPWSVLRSGEGERNEGDRKSTRLNSSHSQISYAVFC